MGLHHLSVSTPEISLLPRKKSRKTQPFKPNPLNSNPFLRAIKFIKKTPNHEMLKNWWKRTHTWWIGGYIELVQTGHSSNSWTLVAGAIPLGPTELMLLVPPLRGFVEENSEWWWLAWISSSSMPSEDDTHSTLIKSINSPNQTPFLPPLKVTLYRWVISLASIEK